MLSAQHEGQLTTPKRPSDRALHDPETSRSPAALLGPFGWELRQALRHVLALRVTTETLQDEFVLKFVKP